MCARGKRYSRVDVPSRERALDLNKTYMALVRAQGLEQGRDTILAPADNVHRRIENGDTGLKKTARSMRMAACG